MLCEMCGAEVESTSPISIEGTVLSACAECARFGRPISTARGGPAPNGSPVRGGAVAPAGRTVRRLEERDVFVEAGELELADDWPRRVRRAREALGWTPEELGKRLNEKKSVVLKLEAGHIHPPDDLVRKLERTLRTRLRAETPTA